MKKRIKRKKTIIFSTLFLLITIFVVGFFVARASNPYVADDFTDESNIVSTDKVAIATSTGEVTLADCYTPSPSWALYATTTVRDITGGVNDTVNKDIYCDDNNCILWTYDADPPTTVCIATDSDVYANVLWEDSDSSTGSTWGPGEEITGDDIGGTHPSGLYAGDNNTSIGDKNWLNRDYVSDAGTYPAMDACKAKGDAWRLPTILELDSIRNQAMGRPYSHLPGIAAADYWSSTEYSATGAFRLYFGSGYVYGYSKSDSDRVRCVRGQ